MSIPVLKKVDQKMALKKVPLPEGSQPPGVAVFLPTEEKLIESIESMFLKYLSFLLLAVPVTDLSSRL
jgi:hypothetical protein